MKLYGNVIVLLLCSFISDMSVADEKPYIQTRALTPAEKISGDVDDACARAGIDAIREDIEFAE